MRAIFQVIANAQDITDLLKDRLLSLELTDRAGLQSDECESRRDDRIAFPTKGTMLRTSLGWKGQGLSFMGAYTVDEIELSAPARTLVIRGKPAGMAGTVKNTRQHAWEQVPPSQLVKEVAARTAWHTLVRMVTTGFILLLVSGALIKLKLFGGDH